MTYYESVFLQVRKAGGAATGTAGAKPRPTMRPLPGAKAPLPGVTAAVQDKMTVTVKSIDPALPSLTVTTPDGRTITRKVDNKKNIEGL